MEDAMRRLFALTALGLVLAPVKADASWGWLEKLSGPGPFMGVVYTVPIGCYKDDFKPALWRPECTPSDNVTDLKDPKRVKLLFGVDIQYLTADADDNPLQYTGGRRAPGVHLWQVIPSVAVPVHPALSVGVGLGFAHFSTKGDVQTGFSTAVFQPLRFTFTPAAAVDPKSRWTALQLKLNANMFTRAIRSEDFGALPGTFKASHEVLWQPVIFIDVLRLFGSRYASQVSGF
jgi:hypothetical protein